MNKINRKPGKLKTILEYLIYAFVIYGSVVLFAIYWFGVEIYSQLASGKVFAITFLEAREMLLMYMVCTMLFFIFMLPVFIYFRKRNNRKSLDYFLEHDVLWGFWIRIFLEVKRRRIRRKIRLFFCYWKRMSITFIF